MTHAIALLTLIAPAMPQTESYDFKRTYKVGEVVKYAMTMGMPGGMGEVAVDVEATTDAVLADGARLSYKATKIDIKGMDNPMPLPSITTKVGPHGLPNEASIKSPKQFFLFLGSWGAVPNTTVKVGDAVAFRWQNDPKDVTFEGKGKVLAADAAAKTLTVDWTLMMTPSYTAGAVCNLKSVYSTEDFKLKSAEGHITVGTNKLAVKASRTS